MENPLITFALFCYNQESYISEALASVLSQTYSPLEIIVSDDCSTDNTYNIIKRMIADYSGPHTVKLNRNEVNLGIGNHVNKVVNLSQGEIIVVGAGDDISEPNRVSIIVERWIKCEKKAFSIHSYATVINERSEIIGVNRSAQHQYLDSAESFLKGDARLLGATHAFSKKTFEVFGPLGEKVVYEDTVIPFRSLLLGDILYIDEPLIRHRVGGISNSYSIREKFDLDESLYERIKLQSERVIACSEQRIKDIERNNSSEKYTVLEKKRAAQFNLLYDLFRKKNIFTSSYRAAINGVSIYYILRHSLKYMFPKIYCLHMQRKYNNGLIK